MLPQTLSVFLGFLAVVSTFFGFMAPGFLKMEIAQRVKQELVPGPQQPYEDYLKFVDDGVLPEDLANPMTRTYWFFNITNAAEVRQGAKPLLQEVGPFRYAMRNRKLNVSFTYDGRVMWHPYTEIIPLAPQPGDPPLHARITTLNLPIIGAAASLEATLGPGVRLGAVLRALSGFLSFDPDAQGLMVTKTVEELLWGYDDPTLIRLRAISPVPFPTRVALEMAPKSEEQALCWRGLSEKLTGASTSRPSDFSRMLKWNDATSLDAYWGLDSAGGPPLMPVNGSDGFGFGFGNAIQSNCTAATPELELFVPDAYRTIRLRCAPPSSFKGIPVVPYHFAPSVYDIYPALDQFKPGLWNLTRPYGSAVLGKAVQCGILSPPNDTLSHSLSTPNVQLSAEDRHVLSAAITTSAPHVLLSPPYFCYGRSLPASWARRDATKSEPEPILTQGESPMEPEVVNPDSLREGVDGLPSCEAATRANYMDIEPYTGLPLKASINMMLSSVLTNHWPAIEPDASPAIVPMFWVGVEKAASDAQAARFRDQLLFALRIADLIGIYGPLSGAVLFACAIAVAAFCPFEVLDSADFGRPRGDSDRSTPSMVGGWRKSRRPSRGLREPLLQLPYQEGPSSFGSYLYPAGPIGGMSNDESTDLEAGPSSRRAFGVVEAAPSDRGSDPVRQWVDEIPSAPLDRSVTTDSEYRDARLASPSAPLLRQLSPQPGPPSNYPERTPSPMSPGPNPHMLSPKSDGPGGIRRSPSGILKKPSGDGTEPKLKRVGSKPRVTFSDDEHGY